MKTKVLLLTVLLATTACGAKSDPVIAPPPSGSGGGAQPLVTADVVGYWSGDWGNLVFREQGGTLRAA